MIHERRNDAARGRIIGELAAGAWEMGLCY
jgi:hypothetical protein